MKLAFLSAGLVAVTSLAVAGYVFTKSAAPVEQPAAAPVMQMSSGGACCASKVKASVAEPTVSVTETTASVGAALVVAPAEGSTQVVAPLTTDGTAACPMKTSASCDMAAAECTPEKMATCSPEQKAHCQMMGAATPEAKATCDATPGVCPVTGAHATAAPAAH